MNLSCTRRERERERKQIKKLFQSSSLISMVSFHELQELFLLSHFHGLLKDEELLLLYEEYSPKTPDFPYENCGRFSLEDMNDSNCGRV